MLVSDFKLKIDALRQILRDIPESSIPISQKEDRIYVVFNNIPLNRDDKSTHWTTFNRRMDALFSDELRDSATGRLTNVKRGPLGMGMVLQYFYEVASRQDLDWELASIKVDRLIDDLRYFCF